MRVHNIPAMLSGRITDGLASPTLPGAIAQAAGQVAYFSIIYCTESRVLRGTLKFEPKCQSWLCLRLSSSYPCPFIKYLLPRFCYYFGDFSSCFSLAAPMHEVSCVGYTPRAWDPCSLQSILDYLLYFKVIKLELKGCYMSTDQVDHLT